MRPSRCEEWCRSAWCGPGTGYYPRMIVEDTDLPWEQVEAEMEDLVEKGLVVRKRFVIIQNECGCHHDHDEELINLKDEDFEEGRWWNPRTGDPIPPDQVSVMWESSPKLDAEMEVARA